MSAVGPHTVRSHPRAQLYPTQLFGGVVGAKLPLPQLQRAIEFAAMANVAARTLVIFVKYFILFTFCADLSRVVSLPCLVPGQEPFCPLPSHVPVSIDPQAEPALKIAISTRILDVLTVVDQ